jgi:branched-subunit amino acid ABC-type transport system permease component
MESSIANAIVDALIRAGTLGLFALGLTIVFKILRFVNFAHCEIGILGGYIAYFLNSSLGMNLTLSTLLSMCAIGLIGVCIHRIVLKPIQHSSSLTKLITTIGLSMVLMSIMLMCFGPQVKHYNIGLGKPIEIYGVNTTREEILMLAIVGISMVLFHLLLSRTKLGKAMRATSSNFPLAEAAGINTEVITGWIWFIASASAGLAGVIAGVRMGLEPFMGFHGLLLPVVVVAIVGGFGNPYGAILGAVVLSLVESFLLSFDFSWLINMGGLLTIVSRTYLPVMYAPLIFFGALILILLKKPKGLMGGD